MPLRGNKHFRVIVIFVILFCKGTLSIADSFSSIDTTRILHYEDRISSFPKPIQASIISNLSLIYFSSAPIKSFNYANEILSRFGSYSSKPYKSAFSVAHYVLGKHFQERKSYSEALEHFFKAEDYMHILNNERTLGMVYLKIGHIYLDNSDLNNASNYLKLSYNIVKKNTRNGTITHDCLLSLSSLYIQKEELDTAHIYSDNLFNTSFTLTNETLAMAYLIKSRIFNHEKNYLKSIDFAQKGLKYIDGKTNVMVKFQLYLNIAFCFSLLEDNENALFYMNKAGDFFEHAKVNKSPSNYFHIAGNIYRNLDEKELAISFYNKHIEENVRIITEKNKYIQKNLQKQYFIHQQKKEIDYLQENNLIKEANLRRNRVLLYSLTSLAALLIFTSGIIIFMQREKYRNRRIISAQRSELTRKQYLEELHDAEIKAANGHIQGQERERERLAKELHDSIGGTLAGIKMELESVQLQSKPEKHLKRITKLVSSTYNEVRAISHNFAIPDVMKGDFQDNLKNLIHNLPGKNGLHIQLSVYQKIDWDNINSRIKIEIYRIIQESIANIIKHAEANTANIQIVEDEGFLNITIEDDGIGFNLSNFKKGLGIRNIKSRIDLLNGKFDLDSSPNNGTFLYFNIPLITT